MPHLTSSALTEDPDGIAFLRVVLAASASNRRKVDRASTTPAGPSSVPEADALPAPPAQPAAVPSRRASRTDALRARLPSVSLVLAGTLTGLIFVSPALSSKGVPQDLEGRSARPVSASKTRTSKPPPKVDVAQLLTPCTKVRKSLWIEGQGWVVRSVSVCR